jgi:hypothetical protein
VLGKVIARLYQPSLTWSEYRSVGARPRVSFHASPLSPSTQSLKAHRPISLLETISKEREALVARRLSCLVEKYRLLPENHFGGRPNRSAEQALNLLVKKIHEALRAYRFLSLLSFDV